MYHIDQHNSFVCFFVLYYVNLSEWIHENALTGNNRCCLYSIRILGFWNNDHCSVKIDGNHRKRRFIIIFNKLDVRFRPLKQRFHIILRFRTSKRSSEREENLSSKKRKFLWLFCATKLSICDNMACTWMDFSLKVKKSLNFFKRTYPSTPFFTVLSITIKTHRQHLTWSHTSHCDHREENKPKSKRKKIQSS